MPGPSAISPAKFNDALRKLESSRKKLASIKGKGEEQVGTVVTGLTIFGAEMGLGYSRGRFGEKQIGGIPIEAVGAGVGHLVGFSGIAGKYSGHLHTLANASLGFVAAVEGIKLGEEAKKRLDEKKGVKPAPASNEKEVINTAGEPTPDKTVSRLAERRRIIDSPVEVMADDIVSAKKEGTS